MKTNPAPAVLRSWGRGGGQKEKSERLGSVVSPATESRRCVGAFLDPRALIHSLIHSFSALLGVGTMSWVRSSPQKRGNERDEFPTYEDAAGQAKQVKGRNDPGPGAR